MGSSDQRPERDAQRIPPWNPSQGPAPRTRCWERGHQPHMWVRVDGTWRWARVMQRQDWPDGRVSYQLDVKLPARIPLARADDVQHYYADSYRWDPAAMRPVR